MLPLVARNRVIGMLTLGKPADEQFRQEILELAEDLSRRAALALDNARLYSERTAISQALQRSLLPPGAARRSPASRSRSSTARPARATRSAATSTTSSRSATAPTASPSATSAAPARRPPPVTGLARHALRLLAREGLDAPAGPGAAQRGHPGRGRPQPLPDPAVRRVDARSEDGSAELRAGLRRPPAAAAAARRTARSTPAAEPAAAARRHGGPGAVRARPSPSTRATSCCASPTASPSAARAPGCSATTASPRS